MAAIRVSGPFTRKIVENNFNNKKPQNRFMAHGPFYCTDFEEEKNLEKDSKAQKLNRVLLDRPNYVFMEGPKTFTGEDVLEIFPHGNPFLIQKILDELLKYSGVRLAEPGEFIRRAFEAGKMDLLQVESVNSLLHSTSDRALRNANRIASGALSEPLRKIREKLNGISTRLELDVDFSEEEADPDYGSWENIIRDLFQQIKKMVDGWKRGKRLVTEPRIVVFGNPNAGKSSLINALLQKSRLIVSSVPGTTRDYVEVTLALPRGLVKIVDTAGLAEKKVDDLDAEAMEKSREQLLEADLALHLVDGSRDLGVNESLGDLPSELPVMRILSKNDLPNFVAEEGVLSISSETGNGIEELAQALDEKIFAETDGGSEAFITNERQYRCLLNALKSTQNALENLQENPAVEILAFEIRDCHKHLSELLGDYDTEEILGQIFSSFCIGK